MDIFGIWDEQVLAGEVMTSALQFTDARLERDVALSRKLGADVHLLAAVDTVPDATRATAERLCKQAGPELHVYDRSRRRPAPLPKLAPATAADGPRWALSAAQELRAFITTGKPITSGQAAKVLKTASGGTSPVGGQIAALAEAVNHHGAALTQPLEHLRREARCCWTHSTRSSRTRAVRGAEGLPGPASCAAPSGWCIRWSAAHYAR
ncbi:MULTISPECIES: hypothetical protein [Streptomycetaceae]|uniref:hypothetical protein n=1 Tax=Streptomycetaceae TaxID=2062 RepID=UPI001160E43A|nr:hypothetical protein [Streptomyces sp. CB02056]